MGCDGVRGAELTSIIGLFAPSLDFNLVMCLPTRRFSRTSANTLSPNRYLGIYFEAGTYLDRRTGIYFLQRHIFPATRQQSLEHERCLILFQIHAGSWFPGSRVAAKNLDIRPMRRRPAPQSSHRQCERGVRQMPQTHRGWELRCDPQACQSTPSATSGAGTRARAAR